MNEADSGKAIIISLVLTPITGALIVNLIFQKYCHQLGWYLNIPLEKKAIYSLIICKL